MPAALLLVGTLSVIWWAASDRPPATLLYGTCQDISQDESYDYTVRFTGPFSHGEDPDIRPVGTFLGSAQVAGDNVYLEMNYQEDPEKSYRFMVVDDVVYRYQQRLGSWAQFPYLSPDGARREVGIMLDTKTNRRVAHSLCPPDDAEVLGTTEHEGITLQHLRSFRKGDPDDELDPLVERTADYWVGPMGRVVRSKQDYLYDDAIMGPVEFDREVVVSGVGEFNHITAPEDFIVITRP